jgi:hypothetical protein
MCLFSCAFAKLRKATIIFVKSVRPYIRPSASLSLRTEENNEQQILKYERSLAVEDECHSHYVTEIAVIFAAKQ